MTDTAAPPTASRSRSAEILSALCAITLGVAMTLALRGYQFGHSNHTVYLIDALRHNHPELLANDWFATHTLQYHVVFTRVTAALDRAGWLRPAFLVGYLLLAMMLHVIWLLWVRALGGTNRVYLLSVVLYLLSAAGFGLGMYEFLQDSSFLPSNVANLAMLAALYCWVTGRRAWAGFLFGVAGFFHLNHALLGIAVWFALVAWDLTKGEQRGPVSLPALIVGTVLLFALALPNIIPAVRAALAPRPKLPLREFVDLYVHLRHPHHYDPLSWPIALWASFLWPFPLAALAFRRMACTPALRQSVRVTLLFCGVLVVAFLFAGVWFVSEPLVQMSLFRFSIYPKVLTCAGAAIFITNRWLPSPPTRLGLSGFMPALLPLGIALAVGWSRSPFVVGNALPLIGLSSLLFIAFFYDLGERVLWRARATMFVGMAVMVIVFIAAGFYGGCLGLRFGPIAVDPSDYDAVCNYARDHTPVDAIFIVPPNEEGFRLVAQRAIVINFKGVPQLSSELGEWRDRLCRVLDLPDLRGLPHRMDRTLEAIGKRYGELSAAQLAQAAQAYHARYVVATRAVDFGPGAKVVFEKGVYHLYDLAPSTEP